jgi:hypothetical protein
MPGAAFCCLARLGFCYELHGTWCGGRVAANERGAWAAARLQSPRPLAIKYKQDWKMQFKTQFCCGLSEDRR